MNQSDMDIQKWENSINADISSADGTTWYGWKKSSVGTARGRALTGLI